MEKVRLYTVYHDGRQILRYKRDGDTSIWYDVNEDIGINYMNPVWSEMVAMYNVWQGVRRNVAAGRERGDYYGFNHYRRQFAVRRLPKDDECQVYQIFDFKQETIYQQYARCHRHEDMDIIIGILNERYGIGNDYSHHILTDNKMVGNCCYLMTWQNFDKMMQYLFDIISEYSDRVLCGLDVELWRKKAYREYERKQEYQKRYIGFIAERLISAWITTHLKPYQQKDVAIVHFNTPELTTCAIRSLLKNTPDCNVFVFDNSDKRPLTYDDDRVTIYDNTKGQIINFDDFLARYPQKQPTSNNWGSAKHCYTVDWLTEELPYGFVLMDSDVLVKRDITPFYDHEHIASGQNYKNARNKWHKVERLLPFLCYLNVIKMRSADIRYFDGRRIWMLNNDARYWLYDTGASFYHDVVKKGLKFRRFVLSDYILHYGQSYRRTKEQQEEWLKENESLWK